MIIVYPLYFKSKYEMGLQNYKAVFYHQINILIPQTFFDIPTAGLWKWKETQWTMFAYHAWSDWLDRLA